MMSINCELYDIFLSCGARVCTDSRKITGGELFIALNGENFNGNLYAAKALNAGAAYAVVDASCPDDGPRYLRVVDTLQTLHELAATHRERVQCPTVLEGGTVAGCLAQGGGLESGRENCEGGKPGGRRLTVIGLTGTNGKTTTKELIRAVLSVRFKVTATEGNLNNDIGVPLTVLGFTPETEIGLVEMGASHPGDIRKLVAVSRPDIGLITNVGKAHLLGFGSFEGVKATKGELYDWLAGEPSTLHKAFLNADSADLCEMAAARPALQTVRYGVGYEEVEILPCTPEHPFLRLKAGGVEIDTQLVGSYNADNVMAALAVGRYFGIALEDAAHAIEAYAPVNKRSQMLRTERNTLVVDAYNANPSSMEVALDNFAAIQAPDKIVLLGGMGELGADSEAEHLKVRRKVEALIAAGRIDRAFFVGEEFALSGESYPDSKTLAAALREMKISGATILVKGSRSKRMEEVIDSL